MRPTLGVLRPPRGLSLDMRGLRGLLGLHGLFGLICLRGLHGRCGVLGRRLGDLAQRIVASSVNAALRTLVALQSHIQNRNDSNRKPQLASTQACFE